MNPLRPPGRRSASAAGLVLALALGGCTTLQTARGGEGQKVDPWENWNRKVFNFNEGLDAHVIRPVATLYANVVPRPARRAVDNFYGNLNDAWSAVNSVLQGKGRQAFDDVVRFGTNSVFGLLGLIDIASELGIERHKEDFGLTLGRWGFGPGAYIVWPLFGPSTLRDSIGLPLDELMSPAYLINDARTKYGLSALQIINRRSNLLGATDVLDEIALDKYTFLRDAYLQRRRSLIYDGDPGAPQPENPDAPDASASAAAAAPSSPASAPR